MLAVTPITDRYLSAAELGITEAEREALIWVREELASGRIKHHLDCDLSEDDRAFDMEFAGGCGTAACIGGWMAVFNELNGQKYVGYVKSVGSIGTHSRSLRPLFFVSESEGEYWGGYTPAQAVRAIDFWATGNQRNCWSLALSEA